MSTKYIRSNVFSKYNHIHLSCHKYKRYTRKKEEIDFDALPLINFTCPLNFIRRNSNFYVSITFTIKIFPLIDIREYRINPSKKKVQRQTLCQMNFRETEEILF